MVTEGSLCPGARGRQGQGQRPGDQQHVVGQDVVQQLPEKGREVQGVASVEGAPQLQEDEGDGVEEDELLREVQVGLELGVHRAHDG